MPTNNAINVNSAGLIGFNGTAFVETTTTNHAVLVGGTTSSTFSNVGPTSTAGQILQSAGASADPSFSTATYPSTAGTAGKVLISDGTNIVSSTPTFPNANATAGKFIRSDGTNWIASTPTLPTAAGTSGKVLQSNGTNYVESTPTYPSASGSAGTILRSDGTNNVYTTATYPATTIINQILYSNAANTITGISSVNSAQMVTNSSGVPSFTTAAGNIQNTTRTMGLAYPSVNLNNVTGDGTSYTVIFNTAQFDQGSNFNTSTSTLTFPVTGSYLLNFALGMTGFGTHNDLTVKFNLPSVSAFNTEFNPANVNAAGTIRCNGSMIWRASANDTCTLVLVVSGSTKTINIGGALGNLTSWFAWQFLG